MTEPASAPSAAAVADREPPPDPPASGPRWRRRWLIVVLTVAALMAAGIGNGAAYWASVELPPLVPLAEPTTVYYADGETVMARLGESDRTVLTYEELLPVVVDVTIAAEDPAFWSGSGGPIARAVVRHGFDMVGDGANARLRAWILARKLEERYNKEEILAYYLNVIPFGRAAYGIEAAARAYFGKSASSAAPAAQQLSAAEAMVLLALVDQPYPDPADPEGSPGFDPTSSAGAEANSRQRWAQIRDALANLVQTTGARSGLLAGEVSALTYPMPLAAVPGRSGLAEPPGLVVNHILAELTQQAGSAFEGWTWDDIRNGGYQITTTIDARAQEILERTADETIEGSLMHGQPEYLQAAGVLVEPVTGRVLAYYGGNQGAGPDYAGVYRTEDGGRIGFGAHPPGTSFRIYALAAALKAGYSLNSRWQWTPHEQVGRAPGNPVRNVGHCESNPDGPACSLLDSVVHELNVPLYDVTASVSVPAVVTMARDAGISALWNDQLERIDATDAAAGSGDIGLPIAYGQYPVTVLDQAAAMATFAGGGTPAPVHFVRTVSKGGELLHGEQLASPGEKVLSPDQLADLTFALTSISGQADLAIVPGNWEHANPGHNAHVWSLGFTTELAAAIWVGPRAEDQPLVDRDGRAIFGSGLPTQILRQVVAAVQAELNLRPAPFPPPVFGGDLNPPGSLPA